MPTCRAQAQATLRPCAQRNQTDRVPAAVAMDYEAEIKKLEADVERYRGAGREKEAERKEEKMVQLQRKWDKEKKVVKPHPA